MTADRDPIALAAAILVRELELMLAVEQVFLRDPYRNLRMVVDD